MITDYIANKKIIFEQDYESDPESLDNSQPPVTEFESIKLYSLFGKLKDIKRRFALIHVNGNASEVNSIMEFLNLIILFYNTLSYSEVVLLINNLLDRISQVAKIDIEKEVTK